MPTHNRRRSVKNLLFQLFNLSARATNLNVSVIVVVDGSTDGTLEMIESEFPKVHIVKGDGSWWYTKSMNEGFQYALKHLKPDYFLTLNDDVQLAEDYFDELSSLIAHNDEKTIIGSLGITNGKKVRVVTSGNLWKNRCLGTYKNHIPFLQEVNPMKLTGLYPSVTLPGRGMIIPVGIIRELGGFDKKFKQYHSDGDFTLRALEKGFNVLISWNLIIYVSLNETSKSTSFLNDSFRKLIKSFLDPVSRNYLPSKVRFTLRHGNTACFPIRILLFLVVSFRNVFRTKRDSWGD